MLPPNLERPAPTLVSRFSGSTLFAFQAAEQKKVKSVSFLCLTLFERTNAVRHSDRSCQLKILLLRTQEDIFQLDHSVGLISGVTACLPVVL